MQLNGSIIRGALKLSCASPSITAAVHTMIKPLLITTTNATFSNDITVTNIIHSNKVTNTYLAGNQGNAIISSDVNTGGSYVMLDRLKSTNGVFTDGVYNGGRMFYYTNNSVISAGDNTTTYSLTLLDENGDTTLSKSLTIPGNLTVKGWASITGAITGGSTLTITGAITGKSTLAITGAITGKSTLTIDGKITGKNSASITGTITATSDIYSSGGKIYTPKAAMNNDGSITGTSATISGAIKATGANGAISADQYIYTKSYMQADSYIYAKSYIKTDKYIFAAGDIESRSTIKTTDSSGAVKGSISNTGAFTGTSATISGAITGGSTLTIAGAITGKSTLAITGAITGKSTFTVDGAITGKNSASITGTITATSDIYSSGGKIYTPKAAMNNDGSITGTSATISGNIYSSGGKIYTPKAAMNNDGSISGTNLTLSGNASVSGWVYAKDTIGIWNGSAWLASMGSTGNISGANVTVSGTTKTNTLVLTANYGTGNPSGGVNGQVYFKII